jgi:HlyD family secretion protein
MTKTWRKNSGWIITAAVVIGVLILALLPQPVPVDVAAVVRGTFTQVVEEDGKTRVRERYTVSAPLDGTVERIRLKAGDPIEEGMVLAVMQPRLPVFLDARTEQELRERVNIAEAMQKQALATVERTTAALEQAQTDYARTKALADSGLAPQARREHDELQLKLAMKERQAAEFAARAAAHQVELARAALLRVGQAKRDTDQNQRWEIRSPVLGRVLRVMQESEGAVTVGTPLLELADPADLEVVVDVLTTDAVQIQPGATVWFERWGGGAAVEGRVRLIEPSAFTKVSALGVEEQRVNVVIDIVTATDQWKFVGDGYRVDAQIVVFKSEDAITVPTGALFRDGEQWAVFVVREQRAHRHLVQIGRRNEREAMVVQGLEPGDTVVLYPSDAVADKVRVVVR